MTSEESFCAFAASVLLLEYFVNWREPKRAAGTSAKARLVFHPSSRMFNFRLPFFRYTPCSRCIPLSDSQPDHDNEKNSSFARKTLRAVDVC